MTKQSDQHWTFDKNGNLQSLDDEKGGGEMPDDPRDAELFEMPDKAKADHNRKDKTAKAKRP